MSRCSPSNKPAIGSKWYRDVNNSTSNRKPLGKTLSTVAVIKHDYCILSDINNATLSEKKKIHLRRLPFLLEKYFYMKIFNDKNA